jgi:hypothetical protein
MSGFQKFMVKMISFYPPLFFSGIRIRRTQGGKGFKTSLRVRWWNRGIRGTHFGASLYAMTDPFFMLILMEQMGSGYVIWDQEATIRFVRAVKRPVHAVFEISRERVEELILSAESGKPLRTDFSTVIKDSTGETVAEVFKKVYIRKKGSF